MKNNYYERLDQKKNITSINRIIMKIVVFGASGPTGQEVVKQALKQDIEVTAIVRQPEKFNIKDSKLDLVQGDVFIIIL